MAIATNQYHKTSWRFGIAQQTAWGIAVITDASIKELLVNAPVPVPTSGVVRTKIPRQDGMNIENIRDYHATIHGGIYEIPISGIVTLLTVDLLLYGVMQKLVSEGAATPFTKLLEWAEDTVSPVFSTIDAITDAGILFTACAYNPATDNSWYMKDCIFKSLKFSWKGTGDLKVLTFDGVLVSGKSPVITGVTFVPASWVDYGTIYFEKLSEKAFTGADLVVDEFEINFDNKMIRVGNDSSNDAENYDIFSEKAECTGSITAKYDDNTDDIIDKFILNPEEGAADVQIALTFGTPSVSPCLNFTFRAIYDGHEADFNRAGPAFLKIPFRSVWDGANEAVNIQIDNAVDRAWTV